MEALWLGCGANGMKVSDGKVYNYTIIELRIPSETFCGTANT